ncbi:MAG: hypothetical protein U0992_08255 [Planctomycetaceae bacterium]
MRTELADPTDQAERPANVVFVEFRFAAVNGGRQLAMTFRLFRQLRLDERGDLVFYGVEHTWVDILLLQHLNGRIELQEHCGTPPNRRRAWLEREQWTRLPQGPW